MGPEDGAVSPDCNHKVEGVGVGCVGEEEPLSDSVLEVLRVLVAFQSLLEVDHVMHFIIPQQKP